MAALAASVAALAGLASLGVQRTGLSVAVTTRAYTEPPLYRLDRTRDARLSTDADGLVVRVAQPVRRVVSQYWSIDEYVYSIVPPEKVVGVSESAWQERISNVLPLVRRFQPVVATDPERVLMAAPDLIFVSSSARADYTAAVRSTGTPIFRMFTMFKTLGDVERGIELVGHLTGHDAEARREAALLRATILRARARKPSRAAAPRVLGLGGRYSYGSETLFHDILATVGAVNVAAEGGLKGYDPVTPEQILIWDPDWLVCGADPGKLKDRAATLLSDPAIGATSAARGGRILVFENRIFLSMSPFVRVFIEVLGEGLYGRPAG
ncbi:MAG: ABC transporter substrate-binding protein [Bryobacterales bacterium]|nr:ABC transporter substrate-binding protein [Bryobacterales bacterium]